MCILWIRSCKNRAKYYRTYLRYGTFCFLTGILTSHIVASQLISSTMFAQKLRHRSSHSQLQGERASTPLLTCISLFRSLTLLILSRELHFFTPLQWNARCRSILVDGEKSFPQPGHTHRGFSWFSSIGEEWFESVISEDSASRAKFKIFQTRAERAGRLVPCFRSGSLTRRTALMKVHRIPKPTMRFRLR